MKRLRIHIFGISDVGWPGIDQKWKKIKTELMQAAADKLNIIQKQKKQNWMTTEILKVMEERRRNKNWDHVKYKELNRMIRKRIKEAKEEYMTENVER
ncbi:hypothetical protein ILUMI_14838 [Ignelater luminosus]|uniref:Uncharacterized protein n=1 Tax=Ignelater luminosus TaxID=2038154 RepID=A0A8K0CTH8_IGNLU|nr:hypothetical protein ILUMI_14838 [Ignelater luminosus]